MRVSHLRCGEVKQSDQLGVTQQDEQIGLYAKLTEDLI